MWGAIGYKEEDEKLAIGLMSGTSLDGIDAALVKIKGAGTETAVKLLGFLTFPFTEEGKAEILRLADGGTTTMEEVCRMNRLIGELSADACEALLRKTGVEKEEIAFVGSHGQTFWHEPEAVSYFHKKFHSTLQLGDASSIAERLKTVVVSDFRTRDVAAGGFGAPLVPYTEYLLFRDKERTIGLQNIGGIGNITILKKGGSLSDVTAFDTGPGNMLIDGAIRKITGGRLSFDENGDFAGSGTVSEVLLLEIFRKDEYLKLSPPKTSGRERYGSAFLNEIFKMGEGLSSADLLRTVTAYTAETIAFSVNEYCEGENRPERLVIGGGGANNKTLLSEIKKRLLDVRVFTCDEMGFSGDAKEAVAFALLANDCIYGRPNNAPAATGAKHPVIMGKITR